MSYSTTMEVGLDGKRSSNSIQNSDSAIIDHVVPSCVQHDYPLQEGVWPIVWLLNFVHVGVMRTFNDVHIRGPCTVSWH